jgi:HPt (histidine-containing phosphotransfer) domain-containing protein
MFMDDLDKEAQLLEQLAKIRENFVLRMRGELPLLGELLGRIRAGDSSALVPLQVLAHRIHGSGATFDFAAVSASAGQIEDLLEALIGSSADPSIEPQDLRPLLEHGERFALEIGAATVRGPGSIDDRRPLYLAGSR